MAVEHFVLFTFKENLSPSDSSHLTKSLYSLSSIPGCTRLTFGCDHILLRSKGYTHACMTRHVSKEAAKAYQIHPEHVRVRDEVIVPLLKRGEDGKPIILSVDFEAEVAEPIRWREILSGAAVGAGLAFMVLRKR
ncbi:hypothetical protein TrVE_jg8813 [Triparma verrucosa]|uniref:Stress-response A/B barrel domain-containing protein n=1 Tax=Triparma verrucosa TaxID=1606542 RepID=A0A9W7FC69_9STRA|nr:hypothetical protein TrVE_jg8813 [Triparma verrucosa]